MNQTCRVCGEAAAGFHFGAFTCEGCKSFFGRTCNNLTALGECKNGGSCVITRKNRTACKSCRLRKCLYVGMSKSGSRYGRRSNWFKIHCLLQEERSRSPTSILALQDSDTQLFSNPSDLEDKRHSPSFPPQDLKCSVADDPPAVETPPSLSELLFRFPFTVPQLQLYPMLSLFSQQSQHFFSSSSSSSTPSAGVTDEREELAKSNELLDVKCESNGGEKAERKRDKKLKFSRMRSKKRRRRKRFRKKLNAPLLRPTVHSKDKGFSVGEATFSGDDKPTQAIEQSEPMDLSVKGKSRSWDLECVPRSPQLPHTSSETSVLSCSMTMVPLLPSQQFKSFPPHSCASSDWDSYESKVQLTTFSLKSS